MPIATYPPARSTLPLALSACSAHGGDPQAWDSSLREPLLGGSAALLLADVKQIVQDLRKRRRSLDGWLL